MSTIRTNAILDAAGGNTATINGITPALSSQAQAEAGTDNTTLMTPLRAAQAITALVPQPTVLLGTITTTSGTTQTLSGLNLAPYRWVKFVFDGINSGSASGTLVFSVVGASVYSRTSGTLINLAGIRGAAEIDLFTGVGTADANEVTAAAPTSLGSTSSILRTSTTTASTSVSVSMTPSFAAGSVRVYGVR